MRLTLTPFMEPRNAVDTTTYQSVHTILRTISGSFLKRLAQLDLLEICDDYFSKLTLEDTARHRVFREFEHWHGNSLIESGKSPSRQRIATRGLRGSVGRARGSKSAAARTCFH